MKKLFVPRSTSQLKDWIYYIENLHDKPIELGLERIHYVANKLNLLHPAPLIVTVGGTNGKGTFCKLLESILLANKIKVGVYSSPHLLHYSERIRIQGNELPEYVHCKAFSIIESARGKVSLSYFEFSTLAALWLFQSLSLDVVILEVGMGGRLDATNVVNHDISVITSISIDHTNWLGKDLNSIAKEKSGIFRNGKVAIVGEKNRPLVVDDVANKIGANLYAYNRDWWWENNKDKSWNWWDNKNYFNMLPIPNFPLENAATVLAAIVHLPFSISESTIRQKIQEVSLPGRFQCINTSPLTILDVSHNPHSSKYLSSRLSKLNYSGKVLAVVGMLIDKDIRGTLSCLNDQVDFWYCVSLFGYRAASSSKIASYLDGKNVKKFDNVLSAWYQVNIDASLEDCILVFGSFQTVAPIISLTIKR